MPYYLETVTCLIDGEVCSRPVDSPVRLVETENGGSFCVVHQSWHEGEAGGRTEVSTIARAEIDYKTWLGLVRR